jgi:hypothetical protein
MNLASPRRRRRGLSQHWPRRVSTSPAGPVLRAHNGSSQVVDRAPVALPRFCCATDRGCHRRGCAEPDVGDRASRFPSPTGQRIAAWDWDDLGCTGQMQHRHSEQFPRPRLGEVFPSPAAAESNGLANDEASPAIRRQAVSALLCVAIHRVRALQSETLRRQILQANAMTSSP